MKHAERGKDVNQRALDAIAHKPRAAFLKAQFGFGIGLAVFEQCQHIVRQ